MLCLPFMTTIPYYKQSQIRKPGKSLHAKDIEKEIAMSHFLVVK